jgi:hypothetical protein
MAALRPTIRTFSRGSGGSALILTVVLTSLLAMVGVLFLMVARIDRMATSATTEHRQLTFAVDSVIALIGGDLVADVPGVTTGEEHYDYPDAKDPWLASLEPYQSGDDYYWRQISNIAGTVGRRTRNVRIQVVGERQKITNVSEVGKTAPADADGDGVMDAIWFEVPGVTSIKGTPIYAAVRVVDNGGMLNVNTGFKFDPYDPCAVGVDGSHQLQINLLALGKGTPADAENKLQADRGRPADWDAYAREVIWRYAERQPTKEYTPFDLSDELETRYRYLLNNEDIDTRLEHWGRFWSRSPRTFSVPRADPNDPNGLLEWFIRATEPNDAYRHAATTYNMDRIIAPEPGLIPGRPQLRKMLNVNTAGSADMLLSALRAALPLASAQVAQIAVNLADYIDDDSRVSHIDLGTGPDGGTFYGFERPCVYISELAYNYAEDDNGEHRSYAIELHKPYLDAEDPPPGRNPKDTRDQWRLVVGGRVVPLNWTGSQRFHVLIHEDPAAPLSVTFRDPADPTASTKNDGDAQENDNIAFAEGDRISLQRLGPRVQEWLTVDEVQVPLGWMNDVDNDATSIERDITPHHCLARAWADGRQTIDSSLGRPNSYVDLRGDASERTFQAHPLDKPLTTIGEIGMVLAKGVYCTNGQDPFIRALDLAGYTEGTASEVLIDLSKRIYADLFNYLTVIDPAEQIGPNGLLDPNETRIQGRININTAPAFVLAQLPWLQYPEYSADSPPHLKLGRAGRIVAFRDSQDRAFESIADLMQLHDMWDLAYDGENNLFQDPDRGPDLTPDDVSDDYEERDLLFTRISNLVTIRSDVFTAYILVRVGADGPQQRVVAVLDRSGVWSADDQPRRVALYQVPDPR